jgi:hypothetical protein
MYRFMYQVHVPNSQSIGCSPYCGSMWRVETLSLSCIVSRNGHFNTPYNDARINWVSQKAVTHNLFNFLAHEMHCKCPNKHYICIIMSPSYLCSEDIWLFSSTSCMLFHKTLTDRSPMNCLHCRKFVPAWCSGSIFEFVLVRKIGVKMYFLLTT